jgi:predicted dehydrogenase
MVEEMNTILIVGMGQMGKFYLRQLQELDSAHQQIVGVDIDPEKVTAMRKSREGTEDHTCFRNNIQEAFDDFGKFTVAIVATNTPSHHRVMIDLMKRGVRWILCEKPLGINMNAVNDVYDVMNITNTQIFTAFLMNFSPAIQYVMQRMQNENLVLTEGSVVWGKNRFGDTRPTPGDLEDETVHGMGILHTLCGINQEILQTHVAAQLTYPRYADVEAQAKAHALDASFPQMVNASTMAIEQIVTDKNIVLCNMHSSFILGSQVRRVTAVLSNGHNTDEPIYSVEFNFDVRTGNKSFDHVSITSLNGNIIENLPFDCNKLLDQTKAFIAVTNGGVPDPRLTSFTEARQAVAFSEAVIKSHRASGLMVTAYTET